MFQTAMITFREGIEAFLIIAITLAYLKKTGRNQLIPAVHWGVGVSVVLSIIAAHFLSMASNKPLWEGLLAAVAAVLVTSMIIYMLKAAKHLKTRIAGEIDAAALRGGTAALIGVFGFTALMITREGMETALLMTALMMQTDTADMIAGAVVGLAFAGALAWAWGQYGHRVNLGRFFQVTSVFLSLFVVQLVIYSFHEFTETNLLPIDNEYWHLATEAYGPNGFYGHLLSYSLVGVPLLWLVVSSVKHYLSRQNQGAAA